MPREKKNGNGKSFWRIIVTIVVTILVSYYFCSIFNGHRKQSPVQKNFWKQYKEKAP